MRDITLFIAGGMFVALFFFTVHQPNSTPVRKVLPLPPGIALEYRIRDRVVDIRIQGRPVLTGGYSANWTEFYVPLSIEESE